jgi:hypothetical protein
MTETYLTKFRQFINENQHMVFPFEELRDLLKDTGGDENTIESYIESLKTDMESNMAGYFDFTTDDFIEDFENYVGDKMSS